jgi:hypothetical protein
VRKFAVQWRTVAQISSEGSTMRWGWVVSAFCAAGITLQAAGAATAPMQFTATQRGHWAWKRPGRVGPPSVREGAWTVNPIDAFVLSRLEAAGIKPAARAPREQLIRRVSFTLTGLPPSVEELDAYLGDGRPDAYVRMVDRFLASPAYGERWARHWLDLARYADTNGYEHDEVRPDMWRYRDYVIRAFNEDKPYDRFVMEQLAGDELGAGADGLIATGFNLLGPDMTDAADQAARRQNTLNDMTDTAGLVFLGLTVGCARCHDHKYEPISQQDYYRLQAFFAPARFRVDLPVSTEAERAAHAAASKAYGARRDRLVQAIAGVAGSAELTVRAEKLGRQPEDVQRAFALAETQRTADQQALVRRYTRQVEPVPEEVRFRLPETARADYDRLLAELDAVDRQKPASPAIAVGLIDNTVEVPRTRVLARGELSNPGEEVAPGVPGILPRAGLSVVPPPGEAGTGRRSALARWIASPANPLTARVWVNRVWQHHFGRGLVPTPSDFGLRGDNPTHPELLDWLAERFASSGWKVRALHRLILTSNTFQQASVGSQSALRGDPENRLWSRQARRRLEAEAIRDAALAVAGRLNRKAGGPGVSLPVPAAPRPKGNVLPASEDPQEHVRRSIYLFVRRNMAHPALEAFDSPDTNQSCARREVSVTAPQALVQLNSGEMRENARALSAWVLAQPGGDDGTRIRAAYRRVLSRAPTAREAELGRQFLARQAAEPGTGGAAGAWTDYCLALLNLNEFVYVD